MATYKQIQEYVKEKKGYVPQTCWIAHTKALLGLDTRIAPNRISADKRVKPCPEDKIQDIKDALNYFGMI